MSNKTLKQTYSFDFDGNGMIKASRTPEDPAPLIRAYSLPFIAVVLDTIALSGRKYAFLCAALLDKNAKNIKSARSAFTIGTIVATKILVDIPRTIDRQLSLTREYTQRAGTRKPRGRKQISLRNLGQQATHGTRYLAYTTH